METKTILLVEDDFLNRRLSKKILAETGYQVLEAKNAREAFEILKKEKVTLAILDINLGEQEQDGISIGEQLQKIYCIPFLYLTAYDVNEIVTKAIATVPQAYLTKPFKNIDLLTTVQLVIQKFAKQETNRPSMRVKDGAYYVELFVDEIDYIEAEGNYLLSRAHNKVYKSRSSIKQILEALPPSLFVQTHRAFIVNKTKIDKFNIKSLVVKGEVIPVSRNYIEHIDMICRIG
ncbi:LytR/AlgR family response regulator transcription factor [Taibaiella chishuiensis]|uniref:LytTR family two component transcriptional regulator n=1 Tax=Taibaiella chishuiensis TaxID=1434707 RepID=A0A2P8CX02_9BACT|nr:response regulator transcription factor [Taibaiella chishuiensis]PSK89503.1 LytTR family two component transcriptional regulator [Taibaiella chishuiensis]